MKYSRDSTITASLAMAHIPWRLWAPVDVSTPIWIDRWVLVRMKSESTGERVENPSIWAHGDFSTKAITQRTLPVAVYAPGSQISDSSNRQPLRQVLQKGRYTVANHTRFSRMGCNSRGWRYTRIVYCDYMQATTTSSGYSIELSTNTEHSDPVQAS